MSRCFPFPPPGYEKKARTDDTDLLTKEKRKEKKHKKDKKDKEKREGKEKKDKERSKDKHKEKKDRKGKDKEKEKKDKDRDKDKTQTGEQKVEKQPECHSGENVGSNCRPNVEVKDCKYVQELARRINDEDRATGTQLVQNPVLDQRSAILLERVVESNLGNQYKEKEKIKDDKKINGFRNHIDARLLENEIVRNSSVMDQARVDRKAKPVDQNNVEKKMEKKEKNKQNGGESKGEKHKDRDREKRSKSKDKDRNKDKEKKEKVKKNEKSKELPKLKESSNGISGTYIVKPPNHLLKENTEVSVEGNLGARKEVEMKREPTKEQSKVKESSKQSPSTCTIKSVNLLKDSKKASSVEGILGKRKELEMKEPKAKESSEDMSGKCIVKSPNHVKEISQTFVGEGTLGKRKEREMNGILHDNGIRPSKSMKHISLPPVVENGRKMEPSQTANQVEPERQGAASNLRVEIKGGHRINGLVNAQLPDVSTTRPSSATLQVNENGELCGKPPHPDSKYLNQILSVPNIKEISDFDDDQEWLVGRNDQRSKPKVGFPVDKTSQVWAESLRIESADIYALPYVIPY